MQLVVAVQPGLQRQTDREIRLQLALQRGDIPLLLDAHWRDIGGDCLVDHVLANRGNGVVDVGFTQQLVALLVDDLALVVGDIIVFQQLLADIEVAALHLALGLFDRIGHHPVLDRLALFHAQRLHEALDPVGGEDPHQVVFQRQVEARHTRVALAPGAAAQLVVDTAGLVPLGTQDVQAAGLQDLLVALPPGRRQLLAPLLADLAHGLQFRVNVAPQHDIGAAAGHIGGDGHHPGASRLGDDLRLLFVVFGVEHLVLDAGLAKTLRQFLRGLHRGGTHQHRRSLLHAGLDIVEDGIEFLFPGQVDQVVQVRAPGRLVGRDHQHFQAVDLAELEGLGVGGAGHAAFHRAGNNSGRWWRPGSGSRSGY